MLKVHLYIMLVCVRRNKSRGTYGVVLCYSEPDWWFRMLFLYWRR